MKLLKDAEVKMGKLLVAKTEKSDGIIIIPTAERCISSVEERR